MNEEKSEFVNPSVDVQEFTVFDMASISGTNNWDLPKI